MKKLGINLIALTFFCLTLVGINNVAAVADDMKYHQTATFNEDVFVSNTILKKGKYRITFYADTGEVKFAKENGDVVLIAKAAVETMEKDAEYDQTQTSKMDRGQVLTKLVFEGHTKYAVLTDATVTMKDDD